MVEKLARDKHGKLKVVYVKIDYEMFLDIIKKRFVP